MSGSSAERGLRGMMRLGSLTGASEDATPAPFAARDGAGLCADAAAAKFGADITVAGLGCGWTDAAAVARVAALVGGAAGLVTFTVAVAGGAGDLAAALDGGAGVAGFAATPDGELVAGAADLAVAVFGDGGADGLAGFGAARGGSGRNGMAPRSPPFGGFDTVTADNPLLPNA